eukprot:Selendium_serpulae@DN6645_c0_g1_i1.p1
MGLFSSAPKPVYNNDAAYSYRHSDYQDNRHAPDSSRSSSDDGSDDVEGTGVSQMIGRVTAENAVSLTRGGTQTNRSPGPPFPGAEGAWVLRERFRGKKSFGWFDCRCNARWISAHAQPDFKQGCKQCDTYRYPTWLWVNTSTHKRGNHAPEKETTPHLSHLCEACK